jgi:hypothetical protein
MSKSGEIPYTWPQIEAQIRDAIQCQASILYAFGPCEGVVWDYLGLVSPSDEVSPEDLSSDMIEAIDITRHALHHHVKVAYDYAYQCNSIDRDVSQSSWHDVDGLLQGFPETDASGSPSPFCTLNDFPLRRVLETFFARFALFDEEWNSDMSIRQLALLSNMTVPAVRTSLSKEGFKLEKTVGVSRSRLDDASFKLAAEDARIWLSRRRGFIPQRSELGLDQIQQVVDQLLSDRDLTFPIMLARLLRLQNLDMADVAKKSDLDEEWLFLLIDDQRVVPDVVALRALAAFLGVAEPSFVAAGIRHILEREQR